MKFPKHSRAARWFANHQPTTKRKKTRRKQTKAVLLRKKKTSRSWQIRMARLPIIGMVLGINIMILSGLYISYRKTILSFQVSPAISVPVEVKRQATPSAIAIKNVQVQLPLESAAIEDGLWEISESTASHLATSARPGEGGNIVIYGHNKRLILANLHQVKIGDTIDIENQDGKEFHYQVSRIETVQPDEIDMVLPTDHELLTVYTCTGFLDSQRLVIQAQPIGVSSSQPLEI